MCRYLLSNIHYKKQKMKLYNTLAIIFTACFILIACKKEETKITPVCDGSSPTYESFVQGLIASKCASCHDYSTYAKLSVVINNGQFKSQVLDNQTMPQGSNLSESELNKLQCWVENNYPEN